MKAHVQNKDGSKRVEVWRRLSLPLRAQVRNVMDITEAKSMTIERFDGTLVKVER